MYYTIMYTTDIYNKCTVNLDKSGNKYVVGFLLQEEDANEYTHKEFGTLAEALSIYTKFIEAFANGCYSYEDRKAWLS